MKITELIGETTQYDKKQMLETKKPKSWCKSISAFANGSGGCLIFGITNEDEVVGLANAEQDAERMSEIIKERLNPIPNFLLKFHQTEDGKKLIVLEVYSGDQTPYYYEADGMLTAFYRLGNQSVPVTPAKLKELVLKGSGASFDSLKSKFKFEDMAFTKLKSTYYQRTGASFDVSDYESFGIVDEDGALTNAGALLADESPVRHSRLFCTRWNGLDKAPGTIDAIDDKEYTGGLINLLRHGTDFVRNNSKKAWKKVADGRVELPEYPERAILEGLVNALIHRSYLEVGSEVHLDMFDDRVEIYSPGGMCDGSKVQERDILRVPSRRRNPVIADIFNRLKFMDRKGSGFKKILHDYEVQPGYTPHLAPEFNSDHDSFLLVMKSLNEQAIKTSDKKQAIKTSDKKQAIKSGDKNVTTKTINSMEQVRAFLRHHPGSKVDVIADSISLSAPRTRAILAEMPDVIASGANRNRTYSLVPPSDES